MTRLRHFWLAVFALPGLLFDPRQRRLLAEMRDFVRQLPKALGDTPLLEALTLLTPAHLPTGPQPLSIHKTRSLCDLAALLDRRSPFGLCLRRSLVRYYFLRRAGLPVVLQFGARFVDGKADRDVAGHAWLTLDGEPYFEEGDNYRGFTVMLEYPPPTHS